MSRVTLFLGFIAAPVVWVAGVWLLSDLITRWPALAPFVWIDTASSPDGLEWWVAVRTPMGFLLATSAVLLVELSVRGWERSALRRLFVAPTPSSRVDRFYLLMRVAGGLHVLAFVLSFGLLFWAARQLHDWLGISLLRDWHWAAQFVVVYVVHGLVFYWGHRLMHTRWFWTIHKVHHAAEELNVVTPLRNHPIDLAVMTLLHIGPAALLGASPLVVVIHAGVNALYQAFVHSELHWRGRLWDAIWITPAAHRLHHSNRPDHFDHNFGILTVWDRVFGTYLPPDPSGPGAPAITYGVEDGDLFNSPKHLREVLANVRRWFLSVAPHARR
jgi:sterol desaturase/sphingolipid hydroxylase (fatty acid hydroxylase superfamily)